MRAAWVVLVCASLGGCAQFWRWEEPPQRTIIDPVKPPTERPMQLVPESYRVVKGDTLYSIAFRNNLDFRELARWNGIGNDYLIVPDQLLQLSAPDGMAESPPQTSVEPEPTPEADAPIAVAGLPPLPLPPSIPPAPLPNRLPEPAAPKPVPVEPSLPAPVPGSNGWQWPTAGSVLRSYAPTQGVKGIVFTGNLGQPVFAAAAGRVVYSGNALKGYGELIIIKHDDTHLSAYGYNRKRHVKEGDVVTTGQPIGELGLGPENKPSLHFEIRERGKPVNPKKFLPQRTASG